MSQQHTSGAKAIIHDEQAQRFEKSVDGAVAELAYRRLEDRMIITHTGVPQSIGGRGIGGELVAAAVDYAEAEHLTVTPQCWFAARWLDRHPEAAARIRVA